MKGANISELKAQLSAYVRRVRAGETILVFDRDTLVARLVPAGVKHGLAITKPTKPKSSIPNRGRTKAQRVDDAVDLLSVDRAR